MTISMTMPVGLASRAVRGPVPASSLRGEMYGKPLSQREYECLRLYAWLGRWTDVAAALSLSPQTVKNHRQSASHKLGVRFTIQAYVALGWLQPPDGIT